MLMPEPNYKRNRVNIGDPKGPWPSQRLLLLVLCVCLFIQCAWVYSSHGRLLSELEHSFICRFSVTLPYLVPDICRRPQSNGANRKQVNESGCKLLLDCSRWPFCFWIGLLSRSSWDVWIACRRHRERKYFSCLFFSPLYDVPRQASCVFRSLWTQRMGKEEDVGLNAILTPRPSP